VIQQLGRGLRYNHELPESQNLLNVFIGRDPRLAPIIEHMEREVPPAAVRPREDAEQAGYDVPIELEEEQREDDDFGGRPEIVDVMEAGDAFLDHTGRFVEGQQLTMFGVPSPLPAAAAAPVAEPEVVDLAGEMRDAVEYCKLWTNRAARRRAEIRGKGENHHAQLNLAYARETGRRGTLSTPQEYLHKGDWMKRIYLRMLG
ncbi:MAG: hypothetical protein M0R74_13355, partial [Dehalococcoidia bacterium]|nr:hypothetical protein [Dehalococcoidia bacterium]